MLIMLEKLKFLRPKTTTDWLMFAAIAGISMVSPGAAAKVVLAFIKEELAGSKVKKPTTKQITRTIYDLKKRKIIELKEVGDKTHLLLTEKGARRKLRFNLRNMSIHKMSVWDHKWRMLMFDIPESKKIARNVFRSRIKELGFFQFQKSVWVYPYPCENEVDFLAEYFEIAEYIHFLTIKIEDDNPLCVEFGL